MSLHLGDIAPDFTVDSTRGVIRFHDWLGDSWGMLFSHPADFTPVCTTELGAVARLGPEFVARGVKVIGLSVDPVESHLRWEGDVAATQSTVVVDRSGDHHGGHHPGVLVVEDVAVVDGAPAA
jgi:alkyl hydroperoxide reductase subunit AhpC